MGGRGKKEKKGRGKENNMKEKRSIKKNPGYHNMPGITTH